VSPRVSALPNTSQHQPGSGARADVAALRRRGPVDPSNRPAGSSAASSKGDNHQKLGTAGFIISIVALVAALGGGAYAASGGLSGKQKKEVTKIAQTEAKKFAGKTGATGSAGANGTNGAKGDTGAAGSTGAEGKQGPEGKPGKEGPEGEPGEDGSPWTLGGVLPANATETGTWSASGLEGTEVLVPISFAIPLKAGLAAAKTHVVPATGEGVCNGTAEAPKAPAGELCVYKQEFTGVTLFGVTKISGVEAGTGKSGAFIGLEGVTSASQAYGSWAVTGN
jgi:collagen type VII alpha